MRNNKTSQTRKAAQNDFDSLKLARNLGMATVAGSATLSMAAFGAAKYVVEQLTKPQPLNSMDNFTFSPFELQLEFELVRFPTADGSLLEGWLLPRPDDQRVVISVSGYRGRKEDMLGISSYLWRKGYNVLLFDYRGYGARRSKSDILTLGHRELEDYQAALRFVRSRFDQPLIGAVGGSMGAAVSLVAAARDEGILAVWSDSAFANQREVIATAWKTTTHLPDWPVVDLAERLFEERTGYSWREFSPVKEIARIAPRPVFLIHAANDSIAPVSDAYALYKAAAGPKELWIEDGLEHCGVYFNSREEYCRRALAFFEQYLVPAEVDHLAKAG